MGFRELLVSGLCVTANRPAFLERAVAWWQAQEWPRKELVVVDGSRKGLRLDLSKKSGVKHVILDPDESTGAKHNRALAEAQGEILAYWDDDDWWSPRRLVKQLEPIALGRASITGIPRDLVVYTPSARFVRFRSAGDRGPAKIWVGNALGINLRFRFHDGSAVFTRRALRHGVQHPPLKVGQKVVFLNGLIDAGERWAAVPNEGLFVYVRHATNTWNYVAHRVEVPATTPSFLPAAVVDFWRKGVA
jgi:glycosyltransferase involved in cell wall biosynthesis